MFRWQPRQPNRPMNRQGATMVETAISLTMFITLLLGMVDLGYGVFQQHVLTQSARRLARMAIVRGALADQLNQWGPDSISGTAAEASFTAQGIAPSLVGLDPSQVEIQMDWIDQNNDPRLGGRVRVQLNTVYRPMMTALFASPTIPLSAKSNNVHNSLASVLGRPGEPIPAARALSNKRVRNHGPVNSSPCPTPSRTPRSTCRNTRMVRHHAAVAVRHDGSGCGRWTADGDTATTAE